MAETNVRKNCPIQIVLEVEDHDAMVRTLRAIGKAGVSVRPEALKRTGVSDRTTVQVDMGTLTEKQHQTLELALEKGYYERPREADLSDLAEELDISKSAVSQRLRGAQTKLVKNVFGTLQSY